MLQLHASDLPAACDARMITASQQFAIPYAARAGGYCDGAVVVNHSASLQLVSYTMGPVEFPVQAANVKLHSAAPSEAALLKVVGLDVRPSGSYRFDAMLQAAGLELDLTRAIHPMGLKPENIGFVAWTERNGKSMYVPLLMRDRQASEAPLLVMRAPTAVVLAAYQICLEGHACGSQHRWANNLPAGSRLELRLPRGSAAQIAQLKLTIQAPGGAVIGAVFQLFIP